MNIKELIEELSKLDPTLPVVMSQEDEPLGDYEVTKISVINMYQQPKIQNPPVWYVDDWLKNSIRNSVVFLSYD